MGHLKGKENTKGLQYLDSSPKNENCQKLQWNYHVQGPER